ncbi:hypothetical protein ACIQXF_07495 [Lysinibacillus sp. NPDC097231]|uniref:hypothetical protein n=1 Tax=Lysinibacillus sp. NPDC097231 TaxID=3364142 RepID=UPI0037FE0195
MAKELKISIIKNLYELEREGIIVTVIGKGAYVASTGKLKSKMIEEKLTEAITNAK